MSKAIDLERNPLHLGRGATAIVQQAFTGDPSWYERYAKRNAADGAEGRLVTVHTFEASWTSWEMHPKGHEVVVCLAGTMTLHQELPDGGKRTCKLAPYQAVINEPGVWHTADVSAPAMALFITAGEGTQHRPRL